MRVYPFNALRPRPELAPRVASVPYDVVSRSEAAALADGNPLSFLHVVRPEIDLPAHVDPHEPEVYAQGRRSLERLIATGVLVRDPEPAVYVYRLVRDSRAQVGVVACVDLEDYERGVIKKHEKTRRDKEDDRTRHLLALGCHTEPVFLAYPGRGALDAPVSSVSSGQPLYDFTAVDGVRHTVWRVPDPEIAFLGALVEDNGTTTLVGERPYRGSAPRSVPGKTAGVVAQVSRGTLPRGWAHDPPL